MIEFDCRLTRPNFRFDVTFRSDAGVTALFGPSGSGKSTAIRIIAGLENPEQGRIRVGDVVLLDTARGHSIPCNRRRIGLVFQDALLFPHLDVRSNLLYGRWFTPPGERTTNFDAVVGVLGIGHLLARRPDTLSGGERQRVAIGRALLASPKILLLDEPLASLDTARKLEILPFIERLRDEFRLPIVYVSHSTEEVVRLADHIVRFEDGRAIAAGPPQDALATVPGFDTIDRFDVASLLSGHVAQFLDDYQVSVVQHPAGNIVVPGRLETDRRRVKVLVRAINVSLAVGEIGNLSVRTVLSGHVTSVRQTAAASTLVTVELVGGDLLSAALTRMAVDQLQLAEGVPVKALIKSVSIDERSLAGHQDDAPPQL